MLRFIFLATWRLDVHLPTGCPVKLSTLWFCCFLGFHITYDWVAAWGHFPCWRPHQTCHLWKLALGLCDVQLSSDFNMSETLTHTVKWPQELAIYGPRPDLWPLRFGKNFEPLSRLNLESYLSSYLWRTIFQLVCGISPYSALLGLTGSFIAFADWPN